MSKEFAEPLPQIPTGVARTLGIPPYTLEELPRVLQATKQSIYALEDKYFLSEKDLLLLDHFQNHKEALEVALETFCNKQHRHGGSAGSHASEFEYCSEASNCRFKSFIP